MSATAARPQAAPAAAAAIPGPAGHPLLGMARALRDDLIGTLQRGFADHGDVVAYRVGPARGPRRAQRLVVAVHHPDDVRRIFTELDSFTRATPSYRVVRELCGRNIVVVEGDEWRRQKRLLQPLFTRAAADQCAALVEQEARAVVEQIAASPEEPVDALRTTERYALRVLGRTLFRDERGIDEQTTAALARLVPVADRQIVERVRQPLRLPLRAPTPRNRRFAETRDALRATIERVLARQPPRGDGDGDLAGKLRAARDPEGGRPLSEQEVRDQALLFLLAGYSTTSTALCSTLHLLGCHPEVQERVAAGGEETARAAVHEGLRLHPPSYVLGRRVGAGGAEIGGYALPPGTDVLVSPWITHRHPGFWEDPEAFDPWRFVGRQERPPQGWIPFGLGARACIGRHLALLESSLLLRVLLERCRLESLDADYPMAQLISMRPSRPVRIACRPR
jgi:cytochrome P450